MADGSANENCLFNCNIDVAILREQKLSSHKRRSFNCKWSPTVEAAIWVTHKLEYRGESNFTVLPLRHYPLREPAVSLTLATLRRSTKQPGKWTTEIGIGFETGVCICSHLYALTLCSPVCHHPLFTMACSSHSLTWTINGSTVSWIWEQAEHMQSEAARKSVSNTDMHKDISGQLKWKT